MVGTLVRGRRYALSWCDLGLTLDLDVVTLNFEILSGYFSENVRCKNLICGRDIGWEV